jgi:hypothetical protein
MTDVQTEIPVRRDPEPRWPALIAIIAVAGLNFALPSALLVIPRWWFLAIVVALLIPTLITHWKQYHTMNRIFGFMVSGVITLGMIASVILLIGALPEHKETPAELLSSAAIIWATNVLVFSLWYWRPARKRRAVWTSLRSLSLSTNDPASRNEEKGQSVGMVAELL